jgi:hypothetical protein
MVTWYRVGGPVVIGAVLHEKASRRDWQQEMNEMRFFLPLP